MKISPIKRKVVLCLLTSLIFASFSGLYPKKVEAVPSFDPSTAALVVKEYIIDTAAWIILKSMAQNIVKSTTNWIAGGFQGAPLFATDPEQFFLGIADNVAGDFIKSAGFGALCSPFRLQVQTAVFLEYQRSRLQSSRAPYQASCTLSQVSNNISGFLSGDFSQGGWPAWFALTQVEQNNPYGAVLDATAQLQIRLNTERGTESLRLNWAKGFLSVRDCLQKDPNGKCTKHGPAKTPGSVIEGKLNELLGSDIRTLEIADEIEEMFGVLVTQLINKVFSAGSDLFGSSSQPPVGGPIQTLAIYLIGPSSITIDAGTPFFDPGAYAVDPVNGPLNVVVTGSVNTAVPGTYVLTYTATNSSGQSVSTTRTVIVKAVTPPPPPPPGGGSNNPPTITLLGSNPIIVPLGSIYNEPGYIASDPEDGDITASVNVTGFVDTNIPGTYVLRYQVSDSGGLLTITARTVIVQ